MTHATQDTPLTVTSLNALARELLETGIPPVWIEGELSNVSIATSGHWYFTLKDENSQVRAAMFRNRNQVARMRPRNGLHVRAYGRVSLYTAKGDYQFILERIEDAGVGALQRAFEALKQKLLAEGLFDPALKRPLPTVVRRIGLVTSPTGAAVHDILTVLRRRCPMIDVIVYPSPVQGADAPAQLIEAIRKANARAECDVLIVGRGGGSLEDLWAFNDEALARCIRTSALPIVSAVGHEIDFTIADFVADARAPTPSAAAEMLSPDSTEWQQSLQTLERRLLARIQRLLADAQRQLQQTQARLRHPGQRLEERHQRLDELTLRLQQAMQRSMALRRLQHEGFAERLRASTPARRLDAARDKYLHLEQRLTSAWDQRLQRLQQAFIREASRLDAMSPLATLRRGYSITRNPSGDILRDVGALKPGDALEVTLAEGRIDATVTATHPGPANAP